MPHLHLSLQAGDDLILKRMKRRHSRQQAIDLAATIRQRRPDVVFGADFIAGFPTETEAMFANTLAMVEECGLTFLHVFPYSGRPGTPAVWKWPMYSMFFRIVAIRSPSIWRSIVASGSWMSQDPANAIPAGL